MVPGEIFHHALSRRRTHAGANDWMAIQMLDRRGDCIDISRLDDDSFDTIADDVARFARSDHGQAARCRFVNRFGASFQTRWENINRALIEVILEIALKTENANVLAAEFFQMRLRLIMNIAEQPELGIAQIQSLPRFEQPMNPFALDQSPGKNCAENWWTRSRLETLRIDAPRQVK